MTIERVLNGGLSIERLFLVLLVGGLGYACLRIVAPFIPFIWAMILALSTWPYYLSLSQWLVAGANWRPSS
jgi:predicted PurR-regulated permease PerM